MCPRMLSGRHGSFLCGDTLCEIERLEWFTNKSAGRFAANDNVGGSH